MKRRAVQIGGALFLLAFWLAYPALTYRSGTSENVEVRVLVEPFVDGQHLVYKWSGTIERSCPAELLRSIIDSEGVVTRLVSRSLPALPKSDLGRATYEPTVTVPVGIPEGPAVYQVVEVPRCSWMQVLRPVGIPYPPVHFTVRR